MFGEPLLFCVCVRFSCECLKAFAFPKINALCAKPHPVRTAQMQKKTNHRMATTDAHRHARKLRPNGHLTLTASLHDAELQTAPSARAARPLPPSGSQNVPLNTATHQTLTRSPLAGNDQRSNERISSEKNSIEDTTSHQPGEVPEKYSSRANSLGFTRRCRLECTYLRSK